MAVMAKTRKSACASPRRPGARRPPRGRGDRRTAPAGSALVTRLPADVADLTASPARPPSSSTAAGTMAPSTSRRSPLPSVLRARRSISRDLEAPPYGGSPAGARTARGGRPRLIRLAKRHETISRPGCRTTRTKRTPGWTRRGRLRSRQRPTYKRRRACTGEPWVGSRLSPPAPRSVRAPSALR